MIAAARSASGSRPSIAAPDRLGRERPWRSRSSAISRSPAPARGEQRRAARREPRVVDEPGPLHRLDRLAPHGRRRCPRSASRRSSEAAVWSRARSARSATPRASSRRSSRRSARAEARSSVRADGEAGRVDRLERHDTPRPAVELDRDAAAARARSASRGRRDDGIAHRACDRRSARDGRLHASTGPTPRRHLVLDRSLVLDRGHLDVRDALGLRQQPGRDDLLGRRLRLDPGEDLLDEVGMLAEEAPSRSGAPGRAARRRS